MHEGKHHVLGIAAGYGLHEEGEVHVRGVVGAVGDGAHSGEGDAVVVTHLGDGGAFHFYGHAHGALAGIGRSRDVGVDMPDVAFRPRTFAELTRGMK